MKKPNLLFVFSDQHRKRDLGAYGSKQVLSPALDAFAERALRFENCCTNSPVCVPARGSLFTGLYPQKHGAFANDLPIDHTLPSVADALNAGGWHTGYIGKWHLGGIPRDQAIDRARRMGFQTWKVTNCNHDYLHCYYYDENDLRHDTPGYEPEIFGSLACDFVRENARRPWALCLSFATPHNPHTLVKEEYTRLYDGVTAEMEPHVPERAMITTEKFVSREQLQRERIGYFSHISAIDRQFGALMDALRETGTLENTLVVYTSDHGDMLGAHGYTDKQLPYEEAVNVPLLAAWPGHIRSGVTDEPIGLVDLPVSLLSLFGLRVGGDTDGRDLSQVFTSDAGKGREGCYLFDLYPCHNAYAKGQTAWRAIRTKTHTYARFLPGETLLYDNASDPYQQTNLAGRGLPVEKALSDMLTKAVETHDAFVDGDEYVRRSGLIDAFNESQRHFGYPEVSKA